jgi:serine acetyltransferase
MKQFKYLLKDIKRMLGKQKMRILLLPFNRIFFGLFLYRTERSLYIAMGSAYKFVRIPFVPLFNVLYAYSNMDINYNADIKGGLLILHPSMGIVISGNSIIGDNLTLTGGNVIGGRIKLVKGDIKIGNDVVLGANAVILDPIVLANGVRIGASACVVKDCEIENATIIGVPGKIIS